MAWQPQGTLDHLMLDQIADWLVDIEKVFPPFKRFIDFSQLTTVAVRSSHVFKVARRRAQQCTGVEPVQTALFSDDWGALAPACFYESLMEETLIEARAFRDLARAADSVHFASNALPSPKISNTMSRIKTAMMMTATRHMKTPNEN
jgi:hypothetical protein